MMEAALARSRHPVPPLVRLPSAHGPQWTWFDTAVLLTLESASSLVSTRNMTATMLRSRLPSLVAGGRRYAVQRPAPKLARFMATPSADVSPLPLCGWYRVLGG